MQGHTNTKNTKCICPGDLAPRICAILC